MANEMPSDRARLEQMGFVVESDGLDITLPQELGYETLDQLIEATLTDHTAIGRNVDSKTAQSYSWVMKKLQGGIRAAVRVDRAEGARDYNSGDITVFKLWDASRSPVEVEITFPRPWNTHDLNYSDMLELSVTWFQGSTPFIRHYRSGNSHDLLTFKIATGLAIDAFARSAPSLALPTSR